MTVHVPVNGVRTSLHLGAKAKAVPDHFGGKESEYSIELATHFRAWSRSLISAGDSTRK